jgi:hypothetical protein
VASLGLVGVEFRVSLCAATISRVLFRLSLSILHITHAHVIFYDFNGPCLSSIIRTGHKPVAQLVESLYLEDHPPGAPRVQGTWYPCLSAFPKR